MRNLEQLAGKVDLTGGESVYCINEAQMAKAVRMVDSQATDSKLRQFYDQLRTELNRNEQAALAFKLIDELRK